MDHPTNEHALPFLTNGMPGTGGNIKYRDEDFAVEEIPLCRPCGDGPYTLALIEKKGISTTDAVAHVAGTLGIPRKSISFAGRKDTHSVARQWISMKNVPTQRLRGLKLKRLSILAADRHTEKIGLGQLAANRFSIRIRNFRPPPAEAMDIAGQVISVLARRGVPNYFGRQRFGRRGDSHLIGKNIVKGDIDLFFDTLLGRPKRAEPLYPLRARAFYEAGCYRSAHRCWPWFFHDNRTALQALIKYDGDKQNAWEKISPNAKRFLISAYQSAVFNRVLCRRIDTIDRLLRGDIAFLHSERTYLAITEPTDKQAECDDFRLSPTGPLVGPLMESVSAASGEIENPILALEELEKTDLDRLGCYVGGSRRPLRFEPRCLKIDSGIDSFGRYIELAFELDAGCYATSLIREVTKSEPFQAPP